MPEVIMTISGPMDSRFRNGFAGRGRAGRARAELPRTSQRPAAPCEKVATMQVTPSSVDAFASGLRNIRQAIESRLKACGIERLSLGDTSKTCTAIIPGMVIIDVRGNGRTARVTFTRDEV